MGRTSLRPGGLQQRHAVDEGERTLLDGDRENTLRIKSLGYYEWYICASFEKVQYSTAVIALKFHFLHSGNVSAFFTNSSDPNQRWGPSQPGTGDCVLATKNLTGAISWTTIACASTQMVDQICENTTGYEKASNGKYYKQHGIALRNHSEAQAICASQGGNLANMFGPNWSATEPYRLRMLRGVANAQMKLGGISPPGEIGLWVLPDGSQYNVSTAGVEWGTFQPTRLSTEPCISYGQSSMFSFNDIACCIVTPGASDSFLCEATLPSQK